MTGQLDKYEELGVHAWISMGKLSFSREAVGAAGMPEETSDVTLVFNRIPFRCACADLGGAHCILPLPDISAELADRIAGSPEIHSYFPHGVNLELVHILDRRTIQMEFRQIRAEDGARREVFAPSGSAARTGSSGGVSSHSQFSVNGCCAAVGALHRLGLVEPEAEILTAAGSLRVCVDEAFRTSIPRPVAFPCRNVLV